MSSYIPPAENLSEAWLRTVEHVTGVGGHAINVISTVQDPLVSEIPTIRSAVDALLAGGDRKGVRIQSVDTVAGTIFPRDLYADTGLTYRTEMDRDELAKLDASASDLYTAYAEILPLLRTDGANKRGTYFGRMTGWPGKTGAGINQLADRISRLRRRLDNNQQRHNLEDIAVAGEAELLDVAGLQVYAPGDRRNRGFPCLVHIDLTLHQGQLSMAATYRHQFLMTKAYGNLVGLCRLLGFLAQQSGYGVGELVVNATFADAEHDTYSRPGIDAVIAAARGGS
jgi:hypothetical protein